MAKKFAIIIERSENISVMNFSNHSSIFILSSEIFLMITLFLKQGAMLSNF